MGGALAGHCEVCRTWTSGRLCKACRGHFARPLPRCSRCAVPLPGGPPECGACLHEPPPVRRTLCVAEYGFPWDRLVLRFKHEQAPELAALLADCLVQSAQASAMPVPQAFVPVPLTDRRLAERGYDQAWELARRLGRHLQVPAESGLLERRFDGRHQAGSSRAQRLTNLRGAFTVAAEGPPRVQGRHLALVDDVVTTGATAYEAARVLLAAGARQVDLWVVARTPAPADVD